MLRQARPTESLVAAQDKAHKLLPELARIQQRLDWPHGEPNDLTDDTLLLQLDMKPPKGREDQWLENRIVLRALIEGLRTQRDPLIRHQCAAWLRRSALAKFTEIQIPSRPLKSRLLTALEVLAEIANDSAENAFVRVLAKSVLAKDEFVLQLWKLLQSMPRWSMNYCWRWTGGYLPREHRQASRTGMCPSEIGLSMSKQMEAAHQCGEDLGRSEEELALYDAFE